MRAMVRFSGITSSSMGFSPCWTVISKPFRFLRIDDDETEDEAVNPETRFSSFPDDVKKSLTWMLAWISWRWCWYLTAFDSQVKLEGEVAPGI